MLELAVINNPIEVLDEAVILPELTASKTKATDLHGVRNSTTQRDATPVVRTVRRRDREWHNPYTATYPAGVVRPDEAKHLASDEASGPPLRRQPYRNGPCTAREGKTPNFRDNAARLKSP